MDIRIYIYIMNQIDFFKCLADQTRLDILMFIVQNGERCVCDLTAYLNLSQPKISRHLALLRQHKILQDRRQGQWIYYSLHADLEAWCLEVLQTAQASGFYAKNNGLVQSLNINCCE